MEQFGESGRDVVASLLALSKLMSSFAVHVQGMSRDRLSGGVSACRAVAALGTSMSIPLFWVWAMQ